MIEIRVIEGYSEHALKAMLERIREVAPRELTYGKESDLDTVDVNIETAVRSGSYLKYLEYSESFTNDLWIVIRSSGYDAYYQGERYSGESLDEIIHDMFYKPDLGIEICSSRRS